LRKPNPKVDQRPRKGLISKQDLLGATNPTNLVQHARGTPIHFHGGGLMGVRKVDLTCQRIGQNDLEENIEACHRTPFDSGRYVCNSLHTHPSCDTLNHSSAAILYVHYHKLVHTVEFTFGTYCDMFFEKARKEMCRRHSSRAFF
jgi:hypothetical protein